MCPAGQYLGAIVEMEPHGDPSQVRSQGAGHPVTHFLSARPWATSVNASAIVA